MIIELDPHCGLVVRWPDVDAWLLVGGGPSPEAWLVWRGRPLRRWAVARC
jgi:hypothetical protein